MSFMADRICRRIYIHVQCQPRSARVYKHLRLPLVVAQPACMFFAFPECGGYHLRLVVPFEQHFYTRVPTEVVAKSEPNQTIKSESTVQIGKHHQRHFPTIHFPTCRTHAGWQAWYGTEATIGLHQSMYGVWQIGAKHQFHCNTYSTSAI